MLFLAERMSNGLAVFLSIIIFLVTIGLGYLIYISIRKEEKKYKEEAINYIEGLIQKNELISDVNAYISRSTAVEFSLIYIDLDKFSNVIDAFGKDEADKIIRKVAYTILDTLPQRVELTRLQDDKFLAFARGEYSNDEVEEMASKILEAIAKPIKVYGESEITLTASIGISFYPIHGINYKELLNDAEIALYICKKEGGNNYKVYSMENMSENENLEYYNQIKRGIKNKEFCLYYQPIINCETNKLEAVEGLLRWNHPEHGILSPYKFINIMEQSGDIHWVGLWGLECLMMELEALIVLNPNLDISMSMNLSPKQLVNENLIADFQKVIKKRRIPTSKIILELEEFALFEKHPIVKQNLLDLSKLGFKLAIDGFSLDYQTLSKLVEMPVAIIKVDNDFLTDEENKFIMNKYVDMLVDYTKKEGKGLIAEGIENREMMNKAKEAGISVMQGYYFSKPISQEELEEYIRLKKWEANVLPPVEGTEDTTSEALENNDSLEETAEEVETPIESIESNENQ